MKNKNDNELKHIYDASLFNTNDLDVLLHETLKHTRDLLNAEAGSIYIRENKELTFNVFQNDSLSYEDIYRQFHALKDTKLPISEQEKYLAVESLVSQKIIIIDDVYESKKYDFLGVKEFDKKFNYKTNSIITAPLIHPLTKEGIGVIQILNKLDNDKHSTFSEKDKDLMSIVCSFIALSVSKAQQDVVKLKRLNDTLVDLNRDLEKKVKNEIKKNEKKSAIIFNQSKMAAMGEMIGNIAHQWRQPLNTISTIASGINLTVELDTIDKKNMSSYLHQIVDTTQHLSNTIDDFRNFYIMKKYNETFNIDKTIKSCLSIVDATLNFYKIDSIVNIDKSIEICSLRNEFCQTIINIITNAKDELVQKIPSGENRYIFIDAYKKDKQIIIQIKDNAKGIGENVINNIFDQHFSTKDNGSGLGLFMSKQIIEDHMKGKLTVENEEYEYNNSEFSGAKFIITLNEK